jgi:hypothetical protein
VKNPRSQSAKGWGVTLVWLSPGLPADRAELASALANGQPSDLAVADPATRFDDLAVGSLCVVTVFEGDLLAQLARRPAGVRLLVVGPQGYAAPDGSGVVTASSIGELAAAIRNETGAAAFASTPFPTAPLDAVGTAAADSVTESAAPKQPSALRTRLIGAGAILAGLAIGGIVIASTEGASAGQGNASAPGGRTFPGGGGFAGQGQGGGQAPGGTGAQGGTIPGGQQLLACLKQQGFTGTVDQLRQSASDPKLRTAFMTCVQQLQTSSQSTGRP